MHTQSKCQQKHKGVHHARPSIAFLLMAIAVHAVAVALCLSLPLALRAATVIIVGNVMLGIILVRGMAPIGKVRGVSKTAAWERETQRGNPHHQAPLAMRIQLCLS